MISTAKELWNSPYFCYKRVREQKEELISIRKRLEDERITKERFKELSDSALFIYTMFYRRCSELHESM